MEKLKIVYCGTPDFSVPCLELLHYHPAIEIVKVISMPDRPAGRGEQLKTPPVAEYAKLNKLPLLQTEDINKEETFLSEMESQGVDAFIVLAFAQFVGERILKLPKIACFNIHTSLLPKYRGAAPIQYALLNNDPITGVSIQRMVRKMDAGDIAYSKEITLAPDETLPLLSTRLKFTAALALNDFLKLLIGNKIQYTVQDEGKVSFAPTLKKEDGHLNFKESSLQKILCQVRALNPWPGTYCFLNGKRLKVLKVRPYPVPGQLRPGQVVAKNGALLVGVQDTTLRLTEVQLEGKKVCSDTELVNGIREKEDICLT